MRRRWAGRTRGAAIIPDADGLSEVGRVAYVGEVIDKARTVAFEIHYDNEAWLAQVSARLRQVVNADLVTNVLISGNPW